MLIRERLERCDFSHSERVIIDFILKEKMKIKDMTTKDIANATYTSPSTLIRIAHKMKFKGWNELKEAYLKEEEYLETHFLDVDANFPFTNDDTIMSIASKLATLKKEAIDDTLSLVTHDDLQKAIRLLRNCKYIDVYSRSVHMHIVRSFQERMYILHRHVQLCSLSDELDSTYLMSDQNHCAIIISYSGQTREMVEVAEIYHKRNIPFISITCMETLRKKQTSIIAITNLEDNELSLLADVTLRMSSRELIYTKIADFASSLSLKYILDILYSCIFSVHYQQNLDNCIQIAKELDNTQHEEFM